LIGKTIAHYKITAKLGAGGMGEVYRAHDSKLGRDVALKVLPEDLAGDPERRKRFEREARAIAALKHPNIVTIYSVEETDGHHFITMELIEGETLSSVIAQGGMTLERFFEIAIPLAEAVSGAHVQNVTHRDLKPNNIMIETTGVLKVLDFGLAKLLDPDDDSDRAKTMIGTASDTAVGQILGTAAYMSPEQGEGKPIDHRSDIFSLGIVYFEMATGERPFKGDTHISTISSILKDTPPHISQINLSLPRHLGRIVNHCLEKAPDRRFQTATDIRNELEELKKEIDSGDLATDLSAAPMAGVAPPSPMGTPPATPPPSSVTPAPASPGAPPPPSAMGQVPGSDTSFVGQPQSKRPIIFGGMALAALVVVLGFIWAMNRSSPSRIGEVEVSGDGIKVTSPEETEARTSSVRADDRQTAVVLPFENLGPAEDAYFALGVSEEITSRLAAASGLRVISRTSAVQYDRTGKTMKQIGEDLGVDYVLEGTVRWAKSADGTGRVRITPQLIRVADDSQMWSDTYDRNVDDIFEVQTDIATRVIDQMGVSLSGSEREFMDDKPTSNLEAYQLYLQAINLQVPFGAIDSTTVVLLERATQLDPRFLPAWYRLTRHHADMYRFRDNTDERLSRARAALQQAEAVDSDNHTTRLARGYYYYYGFRDYDRALDEFMTASESLPNDAEVLAAIGYIRRRQGHLDETVDFLTRATKLDPQNAELWDNLGSTHLGLRQFEHAISTSARAQELQPDNFGHTAQIAQAYIYWKGDFDAARQTLSREPSGDRLVYHWSWSWQYLMERDYERSLESARKIESKSPFVRIMASAYSSMIEYHAYGEEGARESLESTAQLLNEGLDESPSNSQYHMLLGATYARMGREREAVREAKLAVDLMAKDAFTSPQSLEVLALVYTTIGRHDEAIDLIERLLTQAGSASPLTVPILRLNPWWDPLRDNPRFQELLASREGT